MSREREGYDRRKQETKEQLVALAHALVELMKWEYTDPDLNLDAAARRVATSRRQAQRALEPWGGWRTVLRGIRMTAAAELLETTSLTVAEVASRVGLRSAPQFGKTFRLTMGRSARDWRREYAR